MDIMKFIEELLSHFDIAYMFAVNVATYLIIKTIDKFNGEKIVPTWTKRIVAVIVGIIIGLAVTSFGTDKTIILYSFILSLVSWDYLFKGIIKKLSIDYKKKLEE